MESRDNLTRRESEVFRQILDGTLPRNNFTQREYEIVKQILDGTLPREIGGVEYGTPMLLQHHVRAIYMKSKESAEKKGSAFNASKEASRAFALAVSSLQKRGLMKGNVLTAAGRREEERKRAEQTPQEIRKKEREYEAILASAREAALYARIARAENPPPKTKTRKNPSTDLSAVEQRFMAGYMDAALWTNASSTGISPALEASMLADARKFLSKAEVMLPINEMDRAGHDFWLTRNREGAGFWDGFWGEDGDTLTELAHEFPEVDVYVGDDGLLYG